MRECRVAYAGPDPPPMAPRGVEVYWVPLVSIEPLEGSGRRLLEAGLPAPRLIIVTSPRTPRLLALDSLRSGVYPGVRRLVEESSLAAVGPATLREAVSLLGRPREALTPSYSSVEGLAGEIEALGRRFESAAVLRASSPSPSYGRLLEALEKAAERIVEVTVYRNSIERGNASLLVAAARSGLVDVVAVSSPLQARALAEALRGEPLEAAVAAIGRATRRALEELGFRVDAEPGRPGVAALLAAAAGLCGA